MKDAFTEELFSEGHSLAFSFVSRFRYPWEALAELKTFIEETCKTLDSGRFYEPTKGVFIAKSAKVSEKAVILPPCIVDEEAEIRPFAYVRGAVIVGKHAVVGNSTELKNCILFDESALPHFNYAGDSVIGYRAHMGAGAITCNVKGDKSEVFVKSKNGFVRTGRKKVGAFLGDNVEVGCNSTLNPGTVIGQNTRVYPLSFVRGVLKKNTIFKTGGIQVQKTDSGVD